jgi:diaminohydroxyphosphoribosylaminopyrimidine deaminase/5-amino-6-(5-phosphoribosylamino)uracil reductase
MVIFRAPVTLGAGALQAFADAPSMTPDAMSRLSILETRTFGDDTMTVYALTPTPCSPD